MGWKITALGSLLRRLSAAALLVMVGALAVSARTTFMASGTGSGDVLIWFTPTEATADIDAQVTLSGTIELSGDRTSFTVTGSAIGSGSVDMATSATTAHIVIDANGETAGGEPIHLHGGLLITRIDGNLTGSAGTGEGRFDFAIDMAGFRLRASGNATGGASGAFVPSEVQYAMQARGTASLGLSGSVEIVASDASSLCQTDVLATSSWPEELLDLLPPLLLEGADATPAS